MNARERAARRELIRALVRGGHTQQAIADALGIHQPNVATAARGLSVRPPCKTSSIAPELLLDGTLLREGAARLVNVHPSELPVQDESILVLIHDHRKVPPRGDARRRAVACALAWRAAEAYRSPLDT